MKVTQKDIAKRIGVSTSLVSRVLSGQAHKIGVHPKKIEDIIRVAKELNYVPSPAALALKGKKSRTLGLVVYDFLDPYFAMVINELHELAHAQNYSVLLVGFLNRQPKDSDLLPLYKHSVDGIVILGSYGDLSWTDAFKETPIARIGHGTHPNLTLAIGIDEQDAMRKIFWHLAKDLGLKKIAYASRELAAHHMRRDAAEKAAKFFGCDYSCLPVSSETSDFKAGTNIARALMDKGRENLPQAIVCATDTIAMGIIKRFYECGVRVPEDVAIVGFDDISAAANYIPSITSFRQPVKLFAQKCFNVVSENVEPQILNVEGELLIRKSTMKL